MTTGEQREEAQKHQAAAALAGRLAPLLTLERIFSDQTS